MKDIEILLRELGQARRDVGKRALRRYQWRQVLNLVGYVALTTVVVVILLSL